MESSLERGVLSAGLFLAGFFLHLQQAENPENSQLFWPSDSLCAYVHTQEQFAKSSKMTVIEGDFYHYQLLNEPLPL